MLLEKLLQKLYQNNARLFKPVSEEEMRSFRMTLARHKFPAPPSDYLHFLTITDGMMWNGLRFFGVRAQDRGLKAYTYPNLLDVNMDYKERGRTCPFLIIGEKEEDLIVYSPKEKNYQLLDRMDLVADLTLPRFFDVVYLFADELIRSEETKEDAQ